MIAQFAKIESMTGTIINVTAIIFGGLLGISLGGRLSINLKNTVIAGLGIFTAAIGFQMFLKTEKPLIVLGALIFGEILGEWLKIETRVQSLRICLEKGLLVVLKGIPVVLSAVF